MARAGGQRRPPRPPSRSGGRGGGRYWFAVRAARGEVVEQVGAEAGSAEECVAHHVAQRRPADLGIEEVRLVVLLQGARLAVALASRS